MAKRRPPDQLDLDAKAASDAGMSYGMWKAMQNPVRIVPKKQGHKFTCLMCGVEFMRYDNRQVKYCSWDCHERYNNLKQSEPREAKVKPCEICGKEFEYKDKRQKYCGDWCRSIGNSRYQSARWKKKREELRNAQKESNVSQD